LAAAHYLSRRGLPSLLIEASPQLGGVIQTKRVADCLLEGGPDSFLSAKPEALALIRDLGLEDEVIGSNDHQRATWIRRDGRMIPLPDGLMMMVPTRVLPMVKSPLLSWGTKIRMGLEMFRPPVEGKPDRSVGEFVEDHYGREAVDYLAEPLLSGVYGGDPYKLSVRSVLPRFAEMEAKYGSLSKGTLAGMAKAPKSSGTLFKTLKRGLGSMVVALERSIAKDCQVVRAEALRIEKLGSQYKVVTSEGEFAGAHLTVATPAWKAAELLGSLDASLAGSLARIGYSSSMTVGVIYDRSQVPQEFRAFGFLVPKRERKHLVACTFVDQKFDHRVPPNRLLLRCFLGGADGDASLAWDEADVRKAVLEEIRELTGITANPVGFHASRWPRSMAQYEVGHSRLLQEIGERLKGYPLLFLAGNGYRGIGIPDCIKSGKDAADGFQN
jgi:protoporphyrinogen/coproporphyrinogen III oxidase